MFNVMFDFCRQCRDTGKPWVEKQDVPDLSTPLVIMYRNVVCAGEGFGDLKSGRVFSFNLLEGVIHDNFSTNLDLRFRFPLYRHYVLEFDKGGGKLVNGGVSSFGISG